MGSWADNRGCREVLRGLPKDVREVTVDSEAGSSCYVRLQEGERYLIDGTAAKGDPKLVHTSTCSDTFAIHGNENRLRALWSAAVSGPSILAGKVRVVREESGPYGQAPAGLAVSAVSGENRLQTTTVSSGEFAFEHVPPGVYLVSVDGSDFVEIGFGLAREQTTVPPGGCGYRVVHVWPNGRIEGTIQGTDGLPIKDIPVQAFRINDRQEVDGLPLRVANSDADGHYLLNGLPEGEVVVGINGAKDIDELPWRSTFYPGTPDRESATRIRVTPAGLRIGVDITLPPPRRPAMLRVIGVFEDGSPATKFSADIEDLFGTPRARASWNEKSGNNGFSVHVYAGETYRIRAVYSRLEADPSAEVRITSWIGLSSPVHVDEPEVLSESCYGWTKKT